MRILIAEDETFIRMDLRSLLEGAGFEVCGEARDGQEAVDLARSAQPDLAVLDVTMPRLDGIEAARRILDERPIPIVKGRADAARPSERPPLPRMALDQASRGTCGSTRA